MGKVYIRNDTDGWHSRGLVAVFCDDRAQPRRDPIRASDATGLLLALRDAKVPDADLVIESPAEDHSDGALSHKQFASLHDALSHGPTIGDRIPG